MMRTKWLRHAAAVGALAIGLAACGGGGGEAEETPTAAEDTGSPTEAMTTAEPTEEEVAATAPERDEKFDLGYALPETGDLAFLAPPQVEGVRMAVEDINAAGGVLGQDVTLTTGDTAGDAAVAKQTVARLVNGGADAVVGAAASGMSQEIIQILHDNEIAQCSASNTSPSFTDQENNAYYWRTVPPDNAVAPIIADTVVGDNAQNVAVIARADDYGQALLELTVTALEDIGAQVAANITYDPNTDDFSSEVSEITSANPDAVIIIGFGEAATLIRQLIENGVPADALYGADGLFGPTLDDDVNPDDPSFIAGMKVIGAAGGQEFNTRLDERLPESEQGNYIYGGQAYDCAIIMALAAISADSADPAQFNAEIGNVTQGGEKCDSFEACASLAAEGTDIDYDGASGPLDIEHPDPTFGRYAVAQFTEEGGLEVVGQQDVDLGELEG